MNKINLPDYNLEMTLLGGQAFNFDFDGEYFWGFTRNKVIQLKNGNGNLQWQTYPENGDINFLKKYLRLGIDYKNILKKIQKDKYIKSAVKKYPDIRLLNQDFEQTFLSFILSTNNNIKSIRRLIRSLCEKYGERVQVNGRKIFLFPEAERIADAKLEDLLECKLGFRAKYLKSATKYIIQTNLTKKIKSMKEDEARTALTGIKGIGEKIADCVLVFSLGFDNVTPLDIWAKRALVKFYKLNPKMKYKDMRRWTAHYFEGYAGWAGQYLYEYIRNDF